MCVGGQRHALVTLPMVKTRYPFYRRLGGPQGRSGREILAPTGIRSPDLPARSESLCRLSYPGPTSVTRVTQIHLFPKFKNIHIIETKISLWLPKYWLQTRLFELKLALFPKYVYKQRFFRYDFVASNIVGIVPQIGTSLTSIGMSYINLSNRPT